jgi:hypothetical protein
MLMVGFAIESVRGWSDELPRKDGSNKVRVMKCMRVDQILIEGFVFDKSLLVLNFNAFLDNGPLPRGCTISLLAVMLCVVFEKNGL